jgi:hypothetical protein
LEEVGVVKPSSQQHAGLAEICCYQSFVVDWVTQLLLKAVMKIAWLLASSQDQNHVLCPTLP